MVAVFQLNHSSAYLVLVAVLIAWSDEEVVPMGQSYGMKRWSQWGSLMV